MKKTWISVMIIAAVSAMFLSSCTGETVTTTETATVTATATVTETASVTEAESLLIAEEFLKNSPTYLFDGIEGSIVHVETLDTFGFNTWGFVFEFECAAAGYGDRTGQQLAQVITPHIAIITVQQGVVDGGMLDSSWDMITQTAIPTPSIITATAP